jgi:hypothetical protein
LRRQASEERQGFDRPSNEAFLEAGRRVVIQSELMIVAWDEQEARGKGGTADIVHYAEQLGRPIRNVWPKGVAR